MIAIYRSENGSHKIKNLAENRTEAATIVESGELTQQDGRKKRAAKRLSVTNVTVLLLVSFVVIFT